MASESDLNTSVREALQGSIDMMERCLDDARRALDASSGRCTEEELIREVIHALGWGHANAMCGVETAIRRLRDHRANMERELACFRTATPD